MVLQYYCKEIFKSRSLLIFYCGNYNASQYLLVQTGKKNKLTREKCLLSDREC